MKKFEMMVTLDDDGYINIVGHNDGFTGIEIIGFLEAKKQDLIEQMNHPEKFKYTRTCVLNGEQLSVKEVDDNAED